MNLIQLLHLDSKQVCPASYASGLTSSFRRCLQNPAVFLKPYISSGMSVLDLGCGNGFCTFDIAQLVGTEGNVTAADLQTGMLEQLMKSRKGRPYAQTIQLHKCSADSLNLSDEKFDFILFFICFTKCPTTNPFCKI